MANETQIIANAAAIQQILDQAKSIPQLPALSGLLSLTDKIAFYIESSGVTVYATLQDLLASVNGGFIFIDGFAVVAEGKTTLIAWEVGDRFSGWIGDRYVVGKIISLPVVLPADIDDDTKVKLAIDGTIF